MKEFICPVCGYHTQGTERNEEVLNVMNLIGAVAGGPEYKAYCENCGNTFPIVDDIYEIVEITNVDGTAKTDERALARIGRKVIIGELEVGKDVYKRQNIYNTLLYRGRVWYENRRKENELV